MNQRALMYSANVLCTKTLALRHVHYYTSFVLSKVHQYIHILWSFQRSSLYLFVPFQLGSSLRASLFLCLYYCHVMLSSQGKQCGFWRRSLYMFVNHYFQGSTAILQGIICVNVSPPLCLVNTNTLYKCFQRRKRNQFSLPELPEWNLLVSNRFISSAPEQW